MNDKAPPYDSDAVASLLAAVMVDDTAFDRIEDVVNAGDFLPAHAPIFTAEKALWTRGETINQVTVAHELGEENLTVCGGIAYLSRIVGDLPTPVGVEHYAGIVRRDAAYRRLIQAGAEIVRLGYQAAPDLDAAMRRCEQLIASVADAEQGREFTPLSALLDEFWERGGIAERATLLVRTGLTDLDKLLGGIVPGNLVVVAAQTGVGKSSLLLNIARNAARAQNFRVAIFSLEMSREEWERRLLARESGIAIDRLKLGAMSEAEERSAMAATGELSQLAVEIDDRASLTVEQMRTKLRRLRARLGGLDLVLVDYLQLMGNPRRYDSRALEVGAISRGLKLLAREMDVPIIAAAQLSREVDRREPPIPRLSDLRESGAIEQDADVVMFLYREDKHFTREDWERRFQGTYPAGVVRLIVAKHRNGPTGVAYARMRDPTATVEDINQREEQPAWWTA